jgi:hypothetical protein
MVRRGCSISHARNFQGRQRPAIKSTSSSAKMMLGFERVVGARVRAFA